jgi:hypothetical protein
MLNLPNGFLSTLPSLLPFPEADTLRPFSTRALQRFWTRTFLISDSFSTCKNGTYSIEEIRTDSVKKEGSRDEVDHDVRLAEDERDGSDEG